MQLDAEQDTFERENLLLGVNHPRHIFTLHFGYPASGDRDSRIVAIIHDTTSLVECSRNKVVYVLRSLDNDQ
jgi:hypothetical protein